jgi:hypothetical protein
MVQEREIKKLFSMLHQLISCIVIFKAIYEDKKLCLIQRKYVVFRHFKHPLQLVLKKKTNTINNPGNMHEAIILWGFVLPAD